MFNHLSDARSAALDLLAAVLGEERPKPDGAIPAPTWLGSYLEPETGLAVRIAAASAGQIKLRYGHSQEELNLQADGSASNASGTSLSFSEAGLRMNRPQKNQSSYLRACDGAPTTDIAGRYRCGELDAELAVVDTGGVLYGAFSGFLGQGRMEMLDPVGPDVWTLPCYRALDHTHPATGPWPSGAARPAGSRASMWVAGSRAAFPMSA